MPLQLAFYNPNQEIVCIDKSDKKTDCELGADARIPLDCDVQLFFVFIKHFD